MDPRHTMATDAEARRLDEARIGVPWRRWGPYLAERAWGTVREDYSADGDAWASFPHEQARSRAYRWNEDGLLGISDDQQRLCLALSLWNGADPILKERLFGLTNAEGNHGEDVKELYFYLDALPTSSYLTCGVPVPAASLPRPGAARGECPAAARTIPSTSCWTRASSTMTASSMSRSSTRSETPTRS